ncbi:MAG: glycosyltransferase family 4 protein [Chloroflexota bacterium]
MRVLVLHPRDPAAPTVGGIQTFLHDFLKYAPTDFEITVAGTTRDRHARPIGRQQQVSIDGRMVTVLPLAPSGGLPHDPIGLLAVAVAQLRLRAAMLRGTAILQVHRPYRPVYLAGHRGPRVQFVHVDIRDWPGPSAWSQLPRLYRQFSDRALHAMARIFVVNEPGADILRSEHPEIAQRIEFLPVWYDPATFHPPLDNERSRLRAALLTELTGQEIHASDVAKEQLVLFAGRLDAIKDPNLALDTFAALVTQRGARHARLVIAGSGELRDPVERRAAALGLAGRVHFLGDIARARLADIMRAADVLLLTSQAEGGGPRVVLEALACGLPAVAPPVGEVRRIVEHLVDGWLFDGREPDAIADGIGWVLDQPRETIAAAAVRAAAPFAVERVLIRVYDAYRRLAGASEPDQMPAAAADRS